MAGTLGQGQQFPLKLTLATLSALPIAIVYLFASRHFTRTTATTGLK
jgi:multiple sugar transport system permease protein